MSNKPWLATGVSRARRIAVASLLSIATLAYGVPALAESGVPEDVVTPAPPSEESAAQAYVAQDDTNHELARVTVSPLGELVVYPADAANLADVTQSFNRNVTPEFLPLRPFVASWAAAVSHHAASVPAPPSLSFSALDPQPVEPEATDDSEVKSQVTSVGTVTIGGLRVGVSDVASASTAQPSATQPSATQPSATQPSADKQTGGNATSDQQAKHVSITVQAASKSWTYDGEEHSDADVSLVSGTLKSGDVLEADVDGTVTDVADTASGNNVVKSAKVLRGEGGQDVSNEYDITLKPGTLTVTKRNVLLTSATAEKAYDGKPIDASDIQVSGDGFAQGEGADITMTNPRTEVGTSMNEFAYELTQDTDANNYSISTVLGTQTIYTASAQHRIDIKGRSGTFTYDGTEKSVSGIEKDTFEFDGKTYKVSGYTAEAKGTKAGTYTSYVKGTPVVTDAEGHDVSSQFELHTAPGTLTINRREATVTAYDLSKTAGEADPQFTAYVDGLVEGDTVNYRLSRDSGEDAGTYTIYVTGEAVQGNYDVKFENGEFTIEPLPTPAPSYAFTEGAGSSWTKGTADPARFTIERNPDAASAFSHFTFIAVDGQIVASEDYGVEPGSVKLAIGNAFLNSLDAGEHTLVAYFDDGQAEAKFTVSEATQSTVVPAASLSAPSIATAAPAAGPSTTPSTAKSGSPQTGDIPLVEGAVALAVIAVAAIAAAIIAKRRKSE